MRLSLLFLFAVFSTSLQAQFGASSYYNIHRSRINTPLADDSFAPNDFDSGVEVAAHYWFRLKNQRIEFQPTVYFAFAETQATDNNFNEFGFQFKSNFYLFDFTGDCDCPTFGKQGPALQKGLFIQLSPGYARYAYAPFFGTDRVMRNSFTLGGGIGLDFGISNFLTMTPFAGVRYGTSNYGDVQLVDVNGRSVGTGQPELTTVQLGLTATLRLDKKRY